MGFDNVELASIVYPPLTTIHQPKYEIGQAAVEALLRLAGRGEAEGSGAPPVRGGAGGAAILHGAEGMMQAPYGAGSFLVYMMPPGQPVDLA